MKVKACILSDIGQTRKINQDAALIKVANTKRHGRISLVAVCDGMGGLSKGEVASCKAIRTLESWFHEELCLLQSLPEKELWEAYENSLRRIVLRINSDLRKYGKHRNIQLGTTLTAFLQMGAEYILMNIGDSRIYEIKGNGVTLLTKDQSVVQDKLDKGMITENEAASDEEKSVLLQCIGTSRAPIPEIRRGRLEGNTTIIACSDGFWRKLGTEDMRKKLCPQMCVTDEEMLNQCRKLADLAIERNEEDNISVAAISLAY
ncbi:PP2C family protein-serine/threonine phosphatase [Butyrivibrio sp. YAB3001]|uniref:PP2C family protein-serine/threonine phosphatase n=1 Tax=Butyrivibrio sp. YAB3001 TaxID=1520812 RepID=UPI0008F64EEC|nr:PP2C family serine/threonine-protein phosphatase [Butyrivibrio sp. YAB3001]SFC18474.1 Serine/threonine protein phosphatase PrpC [Butyrivibrio sp. YAB3001]